jgi:hypothetical protein
MAKDNFLDGYVPVAERIDLFYARYPDGRIRAGKPEVFNIQDQTFIWVQAMAWRTEQDTIPAVASAWEEFPGPTSFTRKSEAMNAETSAIGRVLAMVGIEVKRGMASTEDDRNRQPPAAPVVWREKFVAACEKAGVQVWEVCCFVSDGQRTEASEFADEERFKLADAIKELTPK